MVLFALTNITLDITLGVSWWLVKNTLYGTYYLIGNYVFYKQPNKNNDEIMELKYEIRELHRKLDRINSKDEIDTEIETFEII
jgi:hypothetical protein